MIWVFSPFQAAATWSWTVAAGPWISRSTRSPTKKDISKKCSKPREGHTDPSVRPLTVHENRIHFLSNLSDFYFSAVDESFESLLNDLFGSDLMSQFRRKRPAGYIDLMIAFESRKRSCSPNKMSPLNVALPFSFIDFYKKTKGRDVSRLRSFVCLFVSCMNGFCMKMQSLNFCFSYFLIYKQHSFLH